MRVKILSGNRAGRIVEMDKVEAENNIASGFAKLASPEIPVEAVKVASDASPDTAAKVPQPTGGGWYTLSSGERVKGKANAMVAEAALWTDGDPDMDGGSSDLAFTVVHEAGGKYNVVNAGGEVQHPAPFSDKAEAEQEAERLNADTEQ